MADNSIVAAYRTALGVAGQQVTFFRAVGVAPNITFTPAEGVTVTARVARYTPDMTQNAATGYGASQVGSVTLGDRTVLAMAADLAAQGFPLPVQKGDKIVLNPTALNPNTETLRVVEVDPNKRAIAGCIELAAMGVA